MKTEADWKVVLRNFTKFTGEHLYESLLFNNVAGLRPVNFLKFLKTPFLQNTSARQLLWRLSLWEGSKLFPQNIMSPWEILKSTLPIGGTSWSWSEIPSVELIISVNPLRLTSSPMKMSLTHFQPMFYFCTSWKHQKTGGFSDVFSGYRSGTLVENGLRACNWGKLLFLHSIFSKER